MLIIVESPAKAKTISKIVGNRHKVKASVGHIRRLTEDKKSKDGRSLEINGIDIEKDFLPIFEVDPDKKKVVSELKKLAKESKDGILFATDSDREGEAISWHLAEVLGFKDKSKVKRLEFHEITKSAIEEAMKSPIELNMPMVEAQQARQVLDKLVGYKLSPVLWSAMSNRRLSAGRVQSPALALICAKEKEIQAFKPEEYWDLKGAFGENETKAKLEFVLSEGGNPPRPASTPQEGNSEDDLLTLKKVKGQKVPEKLEGRETVEKLVKDIPSTPKFEIISIAQKQVKIRPKAPFITSTLQQAASSQLGFNPKMTMSLAQKLYEGVDGVEGGLITYMRTDSVNLAKDFVFSCRDLIKSDYPQHLPDKPRFYSGKTRNAQEAHEAIRPTNVKNTPARLKSKLDARMWKLYDLIWRHTAASQMNDEIRAQVNFDLENSAKDLFGGTMTWTVNPGFKTVLGSQIKPKPTKEFVKGEVLFLDTLFCNQKFTKPPGRYSAASLIKKLEELGIGRPSTYASIISTLQDRQYVENEGKAMKPTALGQKVGELLVDNFEEVTSPDLTARMEDGLDDISNGKKGYKEVLDSFWWSFKKHVEEKSEGIKEDRMKYRKLETDEDVPCPTCGGEMELKIGRFGEYFQCQTDKAHMFPKNFRELEGAEKEAQELFGKQVEGKNCEECGKEMIVRVSKKSLKPYIACAEYRVGNKHTVTNVDAEGLDPKEFKFIQLGKPRGRKFVAKGKGKAAKKAKTRKK